MICTFNFKRAEIYNENCTATRVWRLHRSVVGQISIQADLGITIPSVLETLQFTDSLNTYRRSSAFDKELQRMLSKSLLNCAINTFPFELHIPGYQFCSSGTCLEKRLARDDQGINSLNAACRDHDIVYAHSNDLADTRLIIFSPRRRGNTLLRERDSWRESRSYCLSSYESQNED